MNKTLSHDVGVQGTLNAQDNRSWLAKNFKWAVPTGFIIVIFTIVTIFVCLATAFIKSSYVYNDALVSAIANPEVISAIGEPIKEGFFVSGNVSISGSSGNAELTIPISGPKGKAIIFVVASRPAGEWIFSRQEVIVDKNNERINLLIDK
ncbi:cytochrome c oxidase assembly factor Coa1 family protein [Planctomycetota bacterium]